LLGGIHSFTDGLRIRNNSTLSGCGTINGSVLVDQGGTVLADCGRKLTLLAPSPTRLLESRQRQRAGSFWSRRQQRAD